MTENKLVKLSVKPPYLGAAYYPEDWDESEQEYDIAKMKEVGINTVRIAEFAWSKIEPSEDQFEFDWLHRVIDRLKDVGIGVILGTPSATPPKWLTKKYPEMMILENDNNRALHGGRRSCCSNNPDYRRYCVKIAEKMAKEFCNDKNVICWQIDNEIYSWNQCICEHCQKTFKKHLKDKFGTIENLNRSWNLNLFSQHYDSFDDIVIPSRGWQNPHILMESNIMMQNSNIEFVHLQADVLHKYVSVPVGTDVMPVLGLDYRKMFERLDIVQFNHYNTPDNVWEAGIWYDYLRNFKDVPFWVTETATCWNGSAEISQSIKPDNYCVMNSWLPMALGAEANMYWLWRTHWAGHELMHGAVLDTSGRPMLAYDEVTKTAETFKKAAGFLNSTRVKTDVAFHFSSLNCNMLATQPIVSDLKYTEKVTEYFYKPLIDCALRPDVIDSYGDLSKYKLLFSPLMMTIEEGNLPQRIEKWVKDGGVWVAGPLTDIRDVNGARYKNRPFGIIEKLCGANWKFFAPDTEHRIGCCWKSGEKFEGNFWFDMFDENDDDTLVSITTGHKAIIGKSAVIVKNVGKGWVIYVGTFPSYEDMRKLIAFASEKAGVTCNRADGNLMCSVREDRDGNEKGIILVETENREATYQLESEMTDILTGRKLSDKIKIQPYEILVLEK